MATDDGERYVRLTLLTYEGGKWVSKLIFLREVDALANKPGLNVFLQSHKPHLKLKKNRHELTTRQYKILFPSGGGDTDIDDWDLHLLIKLTLDLFKTCLNGQETSDLKEILRIRNEVICHASQPAISEQVFFTQWRLLVGCIYSLSAGQIAEARTIIDKYQCGPILQCHLDTLSLLCRNDEHMENVHAALGTVQTSLARIEREQNATSDLISSHDSKLNDIIALLLRMERPKNEQECSTAYVNIPRLKTQLRISGDSDEKVKNVEVFVARALEAAMKTVNDPDDYVRVKDAFAEILTLIERKGGETMAVEQGSVYLHIQCKSISKLRCILEWFLESNNNHQMLQLEAALNGIYREQFKVCLVLSEESIEKLLGWTGEHVPCSESTSSGELRAKGQVNFGIKCHSSESVMQVVQYLSSGEAANKLNKISEALSSLVGGTIKVEANVDLDQFLADLNWYSGEACMYEQQPKRSFTYDENCRRIESMLKDAWTLPKQDRKGIVKRLMFKWHPDKNPSDQEYCSHVFEFIRSVLERLESGNA